ncbi:unnamed protein product [Camellia sinensis]
MYTQMEQSQTQLTPSKTLHKRRSKQAQQQSANVHKAAWDSDTVRIFLELVIKELDASFKGSFHTMTMHGYRAVCKGFQERTNKVHDVKQLQNKYALLKKDWQSWSKLMDNRHGPIGISYSEVTGLIQTSDDWWAHYEKIKVGCCTVDILKQLSGEEISRNPSGRSKQRMNRLANHLLSQHSFYPLYPPMEDTPVDFSLAPEALQIPCNPDILILSSDLAHFVKVLSIGDKNDREEQAKCICVNPGRLARGEGVGFFVELNYGGSPDSTSASVISI